MYLVRIRPFPLLLYYRILGAFSVQLACGMQHATEQPIYHLPNYYGSILSFSQNFIPTFYLPNTTSGLSLISGDAHITVYFWCSCSHLSYLLPSHISSLQSVLMVKPEVRERSETNMKYRNQCNRSIRLHGVIKAAICLVCLFFIWKYCYLSICMYLLTHYYHIDLSYMEIFLFTLYL